MKKMNKKLKISLITIGSIILCVVLFIVGYIGYIFFSYSRIGNQDLTINQKSNLKTIETNTTYRCISYNIGFGAYSQDFTFFLDTGYDDNDKATCGHYSKAKSKDEVLFNITGAVNVVKNQNVDFCFFQEVDTNSNRSHHVNLDKKIQEGFEAYDHIHAVNYHTAFMPYPLYDMHGRSNAGLTTISKYQMNEAKRVEYPISNSFSKFFDLDRCFSYSYVNVNNNKKLYLVNSHMSAYDEGGTIRKKQLEVLNNFLEERKQNNDYVLVGGDFNHDLLTYNPMYQYTNENRVFEMTKKTPDWVNYFFDENKNSPLIDGYTMYASDNHPTCRNNDIEWNPEETYVCCVDGFIASDNIKVTNKYNIMTKDGNKGLDGFAYSDHEPTLIEFELIN